MIELRDVSKVYQIGEERVRALDHANLHVRPKEFVSIIGPSGSGKSTLMNIIGCLDVADAGQYLLDGMPIEAYTENELARVRNQKIGFVFQSFNLIAKLSAEENVELPLIYRGVRASERRERVREALRRVGLENRAKHLPTELSGGQQQRVAIARAVVKRPRIIFADEPTAALDYQTSIEVLSVFEEIKKQYGTTIMMITHNPEIAKMADRVIKLRDGRVSSIKVNLHPLRAAELAW